MDERSLLDDLGSSSAKFERDYFDNSVTKMAREQTLTQFDQFASQLGALTDQAAAAAKLTVIRKALEPPSYANQLGIIQSFAIEHDVKTKIGAAISTGFDPKMIETIRSAQSFTINSGLANALHRAQKQLEEVMRPFGVIAETFAKVDQQRREAQKAMLATLAGPIGDIARTGQWASVLGAIKSPNIAHLFSNQVGAAIGDIQASVLGPASQGAMVDQAKISSILGLNARVEADFAATQLKMAAIAGIGKAFSLRNELRVDAYQSLFGEWRTRPDLPETYWSDTRVRRRMYREAEVDEGLIVATPGTALEVMIESGLTTGMRSETSAVAIVTLGEVSMTVRSRGTRKDAYAILECFEMELRAYVTRKLESHFGENWFKLRASNLIGKAKGIRNAAMERREAFAPLINFIELGELTSLILAHNNWDEVFGEVFINRAEFEHDMQKLIAARRPTMHIRPIDGVRLVELVCVVQRLSEQMADDGAWKRKAELDH